MKNVISFICGGVFALGLMLSGMANPEKVLGFLDIFGQWDASLAFVMIGAIAVALIPFQIVRRSPKSKTIFQKDILLPTVTKIDSKLIIGSVMFGIGWGIAGVCPAPALTLLGLGQWTALYFIVAMIIGIILHDQIWIKIEKSKI